MLACKKPNSPNTCCSQSDVVTLDSVKEYYGKILETNKDLKTSACTSSCRPSPTVVDIINKIPNEVNEKFYGCGSPLPLGVHGLRMLDLGSGSGRDCYVAAALVGEGGSVTGVDMTEEQLVVARQHAERYCTETLGYAKSNLTFVQGFIEKLADAGIEQESMDVVISNCVVNLSPDKPAVLRQVYRALRPGGEFYFSDVYCDRELPNHVRQHRILWGECIAGALYINDFVRHAKEAGFDNPRILSQSPIDITDPDLKAVVGDASFFSVTFRLFKLPGLLHTPCEDWGQVVRYKGSIVGEEGAYRLDDRLELRAGERALVTANTAAMLGKGGVSWLAPHFEFGDDSRDSAPLKTRCGRQCGRGSCC